MEKLCNYTLRESRLFSSLLPSICGLLSFMFTFAPRGGQKAVLHTSSCSRQWGEGDRQRVAAGFSSGTKASWELHLEFLDKPSFLEGVGNRGRVRIRAGSHSCP